MAAYERVTLNRGGRNSRFDCTCTEYWLTTCTGEIWLGRVPKDCMSVSNMAFSSGYFLINSFYNCSFMAEHT